MLPVLLASCDGRAPEGPPVTYDQAYQSLLHGNLTLALSQARLVYWNSSPKNSAEAWRARLLEAYVLILQGQNECALARLTATLPPALTTSDLAVHRLVLRGLAEVRLGSHLDAEQEMLQAERMCGSCALAGEVARARGVLAMETNQLDQAEALFRQSLMIARQEGDRFLEATALLNLGWFELRRERFDDSIDWVNTSLAASRSLQALQLMEVAAGDLGWAYYKMGDFNRSLVHFQDAERQAEKLGSAFDRAEWLANLGMVYARSNDLTTAEKNYQASLDLAHSSGNQKQLIQAYTALALLAVEQGKPGPAGASAKMAMDLARQNGDRSGELYALLARGRVAARTGDSTGAEAEFFQIAKDPGSDAQLRWESRHDLALLYEQSGRADAAGDQYRDALSVLECARAAVLPEEFRLPFLANASNVYDDYIRFLVERGRSDEALQEADFSRAQTLAEGLGLLQRKDDCSGRTPTTVDPQAAARRAGGPVLVYWLGRRESYLWLVTGTSTVLAKLPPAAKIETLVQDYRKALLGTRDVLQSRNSSGSALYDTLVAPVQAYIPPKSRVTIIADSSLNNLNFETLLVSKPSLHFWIDDVTLSNAASLRMLAAASSSSRKNGKLLLIGDPSVPDPKFPPLPSAKLEMQDIEKHFAPQVRRVLSGNDANPAAYFKSRPENFSYIHFVAHGTASQLSPLDSAVILSRSTAEEDSYKLHAREIVGHPLRADLVVVSTCFGSGTTLYDGEGLVGLSWAFVRAGAHNVIGALWQVSDVSTPQLMDQFYSELRKGRSPEDALRLAKLSLLHSEGAFRKPVYWAPFQFYTGS